MNLGLGNNLVIIFLEGMRNRGDKVRFFQKIFFLRFELLICLMVGRSEKINNIVN